MTTSTRPKTMPTTAMPPPPLIPLAPSPPTKITTTPTRPPAPPETRLDNRSYGYQLPDKWIDVMTQEYLRDDYFRAIIDYHTKKGDGKTGSGRTRRRAEKIEIDSRGMLFNTVLEQRRLAIPEGAVRDSLLRHLHEKLHHPSAAAMCADIDSQLFIPNLLDICTKLTRTCHPCYSSRPMNRAMGLYARYDIPKFPFHTISIDMAEGFDPCKGCDAVLVVVDELTKTVVFIPTTSSATSAMIFQLLWDRVFAYYGIPSVIKSDNAATFTSKFMTDTFHLNNITASRSTKEHHTHVVERAIGTLRIKTRLSASRSGLGWVDDIGSVQLTVNRTKASDGDKLSPSERLLGYVLPTTILNDPALTPPQGLNEARSTGWVRPTFAALMDNLCEQQAALAEVHDQGRHPSKIGVGSQVAIPYDLASAVPMTWFPNKIAKKSRPLFIGPFTVISRLKGDNCSVSLGNNVFERYHVSVLKHLDPATKNVPIDPNQPAELLWPNNQPKVRIATDRRQMRTKVQYLVHFWGQHEVAGQWLTAEQVHAKDRRYLAEFDRRTALQIPSKFYPSLGMDLGAEPGTRVEPPRV